jgi:hypothetical protein
LTHESAAYGQSAFVSQVTHSPGTFGTQPYRWKPSCVQTCVSLSQPLEFPIRTRPRQALGLST